MEDRRRAQRQSTVWMGFCHVEGESPNHVEGQSSRLWRGCGVFDFSTLGVGMDFRHHDPADVLGRRISVRLSVGHSADPDDAFMFWAIDAGRVDRRGLEFEQVAADMGHWLDVYKDYFR